MTAQDGRTAAWITAWRCVEQVRKIRQKQQESRGGNNPENRAEYDKYCGELIEQAHIMAALASVDISVGLGAGDWLAEDARRQAEDDERADKFATTIFDYEKRNRCHDCQVPLASGTRMQVPDGEGVIYVCPTHYEERKAGESNGAST